MKLALVIALIFPMQAMSEEYKTVYEDVPSYNNGEPEWYQSHRLNKAYIEQSKVKLSTFLEAWSEMSTAHTTHQKKEFPEVFRHAYEVFEDFYQPHNLERLDDFNQPHKLERIGGLKWRTKQFSKVSYFIVQSKLNVIVTDNLVKDKFGNYSSSTSFDTAINDFKPRIKGNVKALFIDDYHRYLINNFLGGEKNLAGLEDIMNTTKALEESQKRQSFLNQYLNFSRGDWGGWILETAPTVTKIRFNKKYDQAVVYFSLFYRGGEAAYEMKNNKWVLIQSKLTWIA